MQAFRACLCGALLAAATMAVASAKSGLPADFVYLRDIDPSIRQDMRYARHDNFVGKPLPGYGAGECILKRPVANALRSAQAELAGQKLSLKVYDCYRPTRAVQAMAHWARNRSDQTETARFHPRHEKQRLFSLGYISFYSAHSRGVAVDLTIVPRDAKSPPAFDPHARYGPCMGPADARAPDNSLDMGTGFDCFDVKSHTRTGLITPEQRAHRQVLLNVMARQGFKNYRREWWHFSFPAADAGTPFNFPIESR